MGGVTESTVSKMGRRMREYYLFVVLFSDPLDEKCLGTYQTDRA